LNTHDDSFELAMAGGVTSAQVLPGSANAIGNFIQKVISGPKMIVQFLGGQAFVIKLRKTREKSSSSMIIEPPHSLGRSQSSLEHRRWRHLQYAAYCFSRLRETESCRQACGEDVRRYGNRMDSTWALRAAYNEAREIKMAQDEYCSKAEAGLWDSLVGNFPDHPRWEMLVDVLRGRVKVRSSLSPAPISHLGFYGRYPTTVMKLSTSMT
jgi:hypothetical protein